MKKWSYVAALMLVAATGSIVTGCIDNDEPYGIQQIRVATANLLEAKKNAIASAAAAEDAQVTIAKINQQIALAELELKKLQAEAEANKTNAQADSIRAVGLAVANKIQAEADSLIARTNSYIDLAKIEYDKAVFNFEQFKIQQAANATNSLFGVVAQAFDAYLFWTDVHNSDVKTWKEKVVELKQATFDLQWVDGTANPDGTYTPGHFVSAAYEQGLVIDNTITNLTNELARVQKNIDIINEFYDKLASVEDTKLYAMLTDYEGKLVDAVEAYETAKAELEEQKLSNPKSAEVKEINENITTLGEESIAIPAWTYVGIPELAVVAEKWAKDQVVVPNNVYYTLNNYTDTYGDYQKSLASYNNWLSELQGLELDANDEAWTEARLNELKRTIPATAEEVTAAWAQALAIYNNGNEADASLAPNADAVKAAVDAYNAAVETAQPLYESVTEANEAVATAAQAVNEAFNDNDNTHDTDIMTAWVNYTNSLTSYNDAYDAAVKAANLQRDRDYLNNIRDLQTCGTEETTTYNALLKAEADYKKANPNATDAEVKAATATEEDAYNQALKKTEDKLKERETIEENYDAAIQTAEDDLEANKANAEDSWKQSLVDIPQGDDAVKTAMDAYITALDNQNTANEAKNKASDELATLAKDYDNAVAKQVADIQKLLDNLNDYTSAPTFVWYKMPVAIGPYETDADGNIVTAEIPFEITVGGKYVNAYAYLETSSQATFGLLNAGDYDDYDGDPDLAFMLPQLANPIDNSTDVLDVFNKYLAQKNMTAPSGYYLFAAYGTVLKALYGYNVGNVMVNDSGANAKVKEYISQVEGNIKDMEDSLLGQQEKVNQARIDYYAALKAEKDYLAPYEKAVADTDNDKTLVNSMVENLRTAVANLEAALVNETTASAVTSLKQQYEAQLPELEDQAAGLQEKLDLANYQKEQYENGYKDLPNPIQYEVDYWEEKAKLSQDKADYYYQQYLKMQALYDAAVKGTPAE